MDKYYYRSKGETRGPKSLEELRKLAARRQIARITQVSSDGATWSRAGDVFDFWPDPPPPPPPPPSRKAVKNADQTADKLPSSETDDESNPLTKSSTNEPVPDAWFCIYQDDEIGPLSMDQLKQRIAVGMLSRSDYVWKPGMAEWETAHAVAEVAKFFEDVDNLPSSPALSPLAMGSFILGVLGATLLFFLGSLGAIVTGHISLIQIKRSDGALSGRGFAYTGLILGYFVIVASVMTLIAMVLVVVLFPGHS